MAYAQALSAALAQVDSFQTKAAFNNNKYNPIGQNLELEVNNTIGITISISEITVLDGYLFNQVMDAVENGESPVLTLDGVIEGRNGSQEDAQCCVFIRFFYGNRIEAACQSLVTEQILSVFVAGGGTDNLDVTPVDVRFQHI